MCIIILAITAYFYVIILKNRETKIGDYVSPRGQNKIIKLVARKIVISYYLFSIECISCTQNNPFVAS